MSQPTPYEPATDFTDLPDEQIKTKLDIEFEALRQTISETLTNIGLIQRDDGVLVNQLVSPDALSTAVLNLIALSSFIVRGLWLTLTNYAKGDVITITTGTYVCNVAHVSGVFATDLAAGKWILLAATGSSTAASFSVTGAVAPSNGIYLPAANTLGLAAGGLDVMRLVGVASAVNYFTVTNSAASGALSIAASGTDGNIDLNVTPKGTGKLNTTSLGVSSTAIPAIGIYSPAANTAGISARSALALAVTNPASPVNWLQISGAATLFYPVISAQGSDTDIGITLLAKGANGIVFNSNGGGVAVTQMVVEHVANSVNWLSAKGAATGSPILLTASSNTDTNVGMSLRTKGTGAFGFYTSAGGALQFAILHTASAVNNITITGASGGVKPVISGGGSDANIGIDIHVKGLASIVLGAYTMAQFDSLTSTADVVQVGPITTADSISITNKSMLKVFRPSVTTNSSVINTYAFHAAAKTIGNNSSDVNSYAFYADGITATGASVSVINQYALYCQPVTLAGGAQGITGSNGIIMYMPVIDATSSWVNTAIGILINSPVITAGGTMSGCRGIQIGNMGPSGVTNGDALYIDEQTGGSSLRAIQYFQSSTSRAFVVDKDAWMTHSGHMFDYLAVQSDKTSNTTLATIGTATLIAGKRYRIRAVLPVSAGAAGGIKVALAGTCTVTAITYTGWNYNGTTLNAVTTTTTKGNSVGNVNAVCTNFILEGYVECLAAGTLLLQFAQNTSDATTTSILVGGHFNVQRVF